MQAGCGYYMGDAAKMIFMNPREVFGAQFRYKFDYRWAVQIKAQRQRIAFSYMPSATEKLPNPEMENFHNPAWHIDVSAEYNFFRFGLHPYDTRIKPVTPYISLGVGLSARNKIAELVTDTTGQFPAFAFLNMNKPAFYIPIGIGVKWKFAERWQLQACWQHQIYFSDNVEGYMEAYDSQQAKDDYGASILNNSHDINGFNIFNNDVISTLTVSIVFEFGERGKMCYFCDD